VKAAAFEYHAPASAAEAVALLSDLGDGAKVIAGGQSLVPMMAMRLATFEHLVDLRRVDELRGIERVDRRVRIGAMTTQTAIERSTEVATAVPLLARATPFIGHFQIRNRGTVGGSLAHADPAAEYPAVALALDAEMELLSPSGTRTVGADAFFEGFWTTAIGDSELLASVTFPAWEGSCGFAIEELARRHGDFALAGACVAVGQDRCAISLFGVGPTPLRATAAEDAARDGATAAEVGRAAVAGIDDPPSDLHGSADYRRHVAAVMVERAWTRASEEAGRG
jgi:aerobic carbon-monoxide dehydrogenase medium subunit